MYILYNIIFAFIDFFFFFITLINFIKFIEIVLPNTYYILGIHNIIYIFILNNTII